MSSVICDNVLKSQNLFHTRVQIGSYIFKEEIQLSGS